MIFEIRDDDYYHYTIQINKYQFCVMCDFWYPFKYSIKYFKNGWSKNIDEEL